MEQKRLSDLLRPESVLVPLEAATRDAAIAALVDALPAPLAPADRPGLKAAMLSREQAGSTGLGSGVAVPHARSERIASPLLAVGRTAAPIDFLSADGQPVTLIFLLAASGADPKGHLQALAAISKLASDKKLLRRMNKAKSPRELYELAAEVPV